MDSGEGEGTLAFIVLQIIVVGITLRVSILRKPYALLIFSLITFFPLGLYSLSGEGLAKLIGILSFLGLAVSILICWQHKKLNLKTVQIGS